MELNLSETCPELDSEQLEFMRSMPPWEKFQLLNDIIMHVRRSIESRLRVEYPQATAEEIRRRLSTVLLGAELAAKVYGPEPPTIDIPIKTLWYVPPRKSDPGSVPTI
jgi:hypothetical protein